MPDESKIAIGSIRASAHSIRLPIGLVLDSVDLDAGDCEIGLDPFAIAMQNQAKIEIAIGEASLAAYLDRLAPGGLEGFKVRLSGGKAVVEAVKRMIITVSARAICSVRLEAGTRLYVDVEDVDMLGGGMKGVVQAQLDKLNPVIDVAALPWRVHIEDAIVDAGKILLRGTAVPKASE